MEAAVPAGLMPVIWNSRATRAAATGVMAVATAAMMAVATVETMAVATVETMAVATAETMVASTRIPMVTKVVILAPAEAAARHRERTSEVLPVVEIPIREPVDPGVATPVRTERTRVHRTVIPARAVHAAVIRAATAAIPVQVEVVPAIRG